MPRTKARARAAANEDACHDRRKIQASPAAFYAAIRLLLDADYPYSSGWVSGIAAARARGQAFGRPKGPRPSDRHAPEVLRLADEKLSQRAIVARLGISKTIANAILKRRADIPAVAQGGSR